MASHLNDTAENDMSYELHLVNKKGHIIASRELGTWRDHAVEVYASSARNLAKGDEQYKMALVEVIDHNHKELYSHDQRWRTK